MKPFLLWFAVFVFSLTLMIWNSMNLDDRREAQIARDAAYSYRN